MEESMAKMSDQENTVPFPKIEDELPSPSTIQNERLKRPLVSPLQRRSGSGNLLTKLFRGSSEVDKDQADFNASSDKYLPNRSQSETTDDKQRKRRGSLRKTVLGGKSKDRKSFEKRSPLYNEAISSADTTTLKQKNIKNINTTSLQSSDRDATPRLTDHHDPSPISPDSPPRWPFRSLSKVSLLSIRSSAPSFDPASSSATSLLSPVMPANDSTTSDDEELSMSGPQLINRSNPPSSSGDSYFPPIIGARKAGGKNIRGISRTRSPLASSPQSSSTNLSSSPANLELEDWNYSETAFWGYVILAVTWIVFVVGMGSSFGVWSWAWDVGETPYAPPELEDDATLPIVGYYPALLVLTCVMAWVWVLVAWTGMSYFRHSQQ